MTATKRKNAWNSVGLVPETRQNQPLWERIPKEGRCALAHCPAAGSGDPKCALCAGPVVWTDPGGIRHGRARSCHSCPMNLLGLPVCSCACPGPNAEFTTDGESIETMGAMENPDAIVERQRTERTDVPPDVERMVRTIDGESETDDELLTPELGLADQNRAKLVIARLLAIDGRRMEEMKNAWERGDAESTADIIGISRHMLRGSSSVTAIILERLKPISGGDWDILRIVAGGVTLKRAADQIGVSKQAVSARLYRVMEHAPWVARICASMRTGVSPHPTGRRYR